MSRIAILALLLTGAAHPLHYTQTTLLAGDGGRVAISIESETEDLETALANAGSVTGDSGLARYVRASVTLTDGAGQPVALVWEGTEVEGTMTRILLHAEVPGALAATRLRQAMHTELFSDQVNVVLVRDGPRRLRLLFTPGSGPRRLS